MTSRKTKAADPNTLRLKSERDTPETRRVAQLALEPEAHAMTTARLFSKGSFGELDISDTYDILGEHGQAATSGDLSRQRRMLAGQAEALNSIFTELARRAALNMGEHLNATQLYMRLALKAQSQCRTTIDALDRLANGHVQTVKHVHVGEGGQAVIADEFHHHTGGHENGEAAKQPHAPEDGPAGASAALPGPDPLGQPVPISSREEQPAMQNARGQG